ncbi:methylenetetrahydrofolate reductase Met9 [Schizosaccharomyces cryophilus OY26]|uniref:Methylenetetrahydrofolate reductase Met9 n=1 Tax=Schizosaccharomyces cryophilus (strain OY26 / ATCC MYA-4695 / CBS 11777 / NBRC 106824 / NRRL Y48691) TaxID=653667 RepID=S9VSH4_SCHCR|nr:methylenetetrahydrofolate reductase Met9 [Schizosaccharomyces cryophilus OY26]EPY50818.1 methylenetetrahydrofolate reductase Met9 [Schizosaccharomyces cryophilus OY26]
MKISDKLQHPNWKDRITWSYEFFPPKTSTGIQNLYSRIDRMKKWGHPMFIDVTWGAGGSTSDLTPVIVNVAQKEFQLDTCMHLTCTNMSEEMIETALKKAYETGCRNILALRGDPPKNETEWTQVEGGFRYASDLVRYIKKNYGDEICIGVAGYPEGYSPDDDLERSLKHLKEKVDAGASFIVTQMFYDADNFVEWVKKVRKMGITVPIFPGIMPIQAWDSFIRRAKWSGVKIPQHFMDTLLPVKDNDDDVRERGTDLMIQFCRTLIENGITRLHFYTMNLEKAVKMIIERLGLLDEEVKDVTEKSENQLTTNRTEIFPDGTKRANEDVRPIFWRTRLESYISRTDQWDEFPHGRWGDSRSPAFGEFDPSRHGLRQSTGEILSLWGSPKSYKELGELFADYCMKKQSSLPWSDVPISDEAKMIQSQLVNINKRAYLTINSQPALNGVKSSDPVHGWGPTNGYVYQKPYVEFFVHPSLIEELKSSLHQMGDTSYFFITVDGKLDTNAAYEVPNAVTWGVFPNREVIQPTIVESTSFLAWKDEAYFLGMAWASAHDPNSATHKLLVSMMSSWMLCVIVDNNFERGQSLFDVFSKIKSLEDIHPELYNGVAI